jgi:hypothetical protein
MQDEGKTMLENVHRIQSPEDQEKPSRVLEAPACTNHAPETGPDDEVRPLSPKMTPLPTRQIVPVIFLQMSEVLVFHRQNFYVHRHHTVTNTPPPHTLSLSHSQALNITSLFPYLAFMVEDFGFSEEELGLYVGLIAASYMAGQVCSSYFWGRCSDIYGRKPVMILGTLGTAFAAIIFGTSGTYAQAITARFIGGMLNGNIGVLKSFLAEISDETNQGKAFGLIATAWGIGTIIAPAVGGFLAGQTLWGYDYLLANIIIAGWGILTSLVTFTCMVETNPPKPGKKGTLGKCFSRARPNSHADLSAEREEEGIEMVMVQAGTSSTDDSTPLGKHVVTTFLC